MLIFCFLYICFWSFWSVYVSITCALFFILSLSGPFTYFNKTMSVSMDIVLYHVLGYCTDLSELSPPLLSDQVQETSG